YPENITLKRTTWTCSRLRINCSMPEQCSCVICGKIGFFESDTLSATRRELNLTSFKKENSEPVSLSYRAAGVDIDAGDRLVEAGRRYCQSGNERYCRRLRTSGLRFDWWGNR